MKNWMIIAVCICLAVSVAACSNSATPDSSTQMSAPDSVYESKPSVITIEEVAERAVKYYPDKVRFQFVRQDKIFDESHQDRFVEQECYIFDVTYNEKVVSSVAVGIEDGSLWVRDMNSDTLWLSESFMGLNIDSDTEIVTAEPVIQITSPNVLYFARLDTIPEFSNRNEGFAGWNESEKTLTINAVKSTGTVTGAIDGPSVKAVVTWNDRKPVLINVEYQPAPTFSHPSQVLSSGEMLDIAPDRLIEIAEYFKSLIGKESDHSNNQVETMGACPIKIENKWDYQNGYPIGFEHPSHILEIPPNPFHIPEQVSDNYTTSPWIITQGTLSDSTYLPDTFIVTIYEKDNSNYIQVSVEASYGIAYHKIAGFVSPYYIDCMVLYAFNNSDIQKSGGALIIEDKEYQAKELTKYIVYHDDIITVYNVLALLSDLSFEEELTKFIKNPTADYDEGMTPGFAYHYDDIVKTKDYLVDIIPQMIHERKP